MDGIHDLGGKHGFGRVEVEADEPVFHHRWEAAVFTMVNACASQGVFTNTDRFRHAIERIDPVAYLSHGYYGRWLGGIENLLVEANVLSQAEITDKAVAMGAGPNDLVAARPGTNPDPQGDRSQIGSDRWIDHPARFETANKVLTTHLVKAGHTRLPAYARGKVGTIHAVHGGWVYPDTSAHGQGEQPQYLYTVEFDARVLWGAGDHKVYLDLFEPYLEAVNV